MLLYIVSSNASPPATASVPLSGHPSVKPKKKRPRFCSKSWPLDKKRNLFFCAGAKHPGAFTHIVQQLGEHIGGIGVFAFIAAPFISRLLPLFSLPSRSTRSWPAGSGAFRDRTWTYRQAWAARHRPELGQPQNFWWGPLNALFRLPKSLSPGAVKAWFVHGVTPLGEPLVLMLL